MVVKFYKGLVNGLLLSVAFWLLIIASVFAQPTAKIVGPTQVPAGELTALSSTGSTGDNLMWIRPEGLTTILAGCEVMDSQVFFSTIKEGSYEFLLVCTDKEARIAYARHTVTVGKPQQPPPVDPPPVDPPVDPPPVPTPGKWSSLVDVSKKNADAANDPAARTALKRVLEDRLASIKSRCDQGQCPGLDQCKREVVSTIENILLLRSDRFSAWDGWRRGNGQTIDAGKVRDVPDYLEAVKAFTAGL